jgi:hypothetical protein
MRPFLRLTLMPGASPMIATAIASPLFAEFSAMFVAMRIEHVINLKREWNPTGQGVTYFRQGGPAMILNELRPEYADPAAILDVRVRSASHTASTARAHPF